MVKASRLISTAPLSVIFKVHVPMKLISSIVKRDKPPVRGRAFVLLTVMRRMRCSIQSRSRS
jgi:hypothetical protein